jgi:hypothetical protein
MIDPSQLSDGRPPVCYSCGRELPPGWKLTWDGKGRCPGCPESKKREEKRETLSEFAERKARSVTHGRGQYSLVSDD